jgi:hypothetical protein
MVGLNITAPLPAAAFVVTKNVYVEPGENENSAYGGESDS